MKIYLLILFNCTFGSFWLAVESFRKATCSFGSEDDDNVRVKLMAGLKGERGAKGDKGQVEEVGNQLEEMNTKLQAMQSRLDEHTMEYEKLINITNKLSDTIFPQSCSDFLTGGGVDESGVYTIYPYGNLKPLRVYCDLATDGGGWMIFQKRIDGSEDFYRNFEDYVEGFGRLDGEFWLGLDVIHTLTKDGEYKMRVDMEDFDNQTRYALFDDFVVGAGTNYTLTFGGYNGTAGVGLESARFSAKDRDQDTWTSESCSNTYKGGWWYDDCHVANPNGLYLGGPHGSFADGIEWYPWRGHHYSLKRIEMKLKKK